MNRAYTVKSSEEQLSYDYLFMDQPRVYWSSIINAGGLGVVVWGIFTKVQFRSFSINGHKKRLHLQLQLMDLLDMLSVSFSPHHWT